MQRQQMGRATLAFRGLTIIAMLLIGLAFFSPIWWVSLKAPQYPPHTFPDGVRIHFHMDGVKNGCEKRAETDEVHEDEALDCVHEMNVINHYIGMEPIEKGAQIELAASPYLFGLVGLMLTAFLFYGGRFWWVLPLSGIVIPLAFVIDYSAWLWWFGHNIRGEPSRSSRSSPPCSARARWRSSPPFPIPITASACCWPARPAWSWRR